MLKKKTGLVYSHILQGIMFGVALGWVFGASTYFSAGSSMLVGGIIGGLIGWNVQPKADFDETGINQKAGKGLHSSGSQVELKLREERLDITKKRVQTGDVSLRTEVVTEEKEIRVPVARAELVIEKTVLNSDDSNRGESVTETLRIPIREEQIKITKQPVVLENVNVYRRRFQTNEPVSGNLKKERLHIKSSGDPKIINKEIK